jgi:hypothetical protein
VLKSILVAVAFSLGGVVPAFAQECLHGANETAAERTRREQAVQFAQRLNAAQQFNLPDYRQPGPQGRLYRPFEELRNVPPVPAGFRLQFHTDGKSYAFSLKDARDACRFALFSDQDGYIYTAVPQPRSARVIPLETR